MTPERERSVGPDEAREILRRAARADVRAPEGDVLTLAELEEAGRQAGLSPALIRRAGALREATSRGAVPGVPRPAPLLAGAPTRRRLTASLPGGRSADPSAVKRAAEAVAGRPFRKLNTGPGRWAWESRVGLEGVVVRLEESGEGETFLVVEGSRAGGFAALYGGTLVGLAAASGAAGALAAVAATAGPLVAAAGLLGIPLLIARPLYRRGDPPFRDRLEDLAMGLLEALEEPDGLERSDDLAVATDDRERTTDGQEEPTDALDGPDERETGKPA